MNNLWTPIERAGCAAQYRSHFRQQAEAPAVVIPVLASLVLVGTAGARIQLRAVENDQWDAIREARHEEARFERGIEWFQTRQFSHIAGGSQNTGIAGQ